MSTFQMIENVMKKPSTLARKTNRGNEHNAYPGNGCVTAIQTVLMVLTRI